MPSLTFNPDHSRTLDKPVSLVEVHVGSLLVTEFDNPVFLDAGDSKAYDPPIASLTCYSPTSARVAVTYDDETIPVAPPSRGDRDSAGSPTGGTGPLESRTEKELRKLASERNIPGRSKLDKAGLIEKLRG